MNTKTLSSLIILLSLFFVSCSGDKLSLSSPEDISKIKSIVLEKFDEDLEIYSLSLSSFKELNGEFQYAEVDYLKDGKSYSRLYNAYPGIKPKLEDEKMGNESFQTPFHLKSKQGKVKLKDISFEKIPEQATKAFELINEEFDNYVLHSYDIDSKTNKISAIMQFHCTPNEGLTGIQGRNIVTNYYEINFDVDQNGTVTIKE